MNRKNCFSLLILLIFLCIFSLSYAQENTDYSALDKDMYSEDTDAEYIVIDGRSYRVSKGFALPFWYSEGTPVKINFADDANTVLSIERMQDDESINEGLEYHFGIVNAVSMADEDMSYRVYVDGIGYKFDSNTRVDERIATLRKYASVALVTYNQRVIICKVLASNTTLKQSDMFVGMVQYVKQTEAGTEIMVNDTKHLLVDGTDIVGMVALEGEWVFGYDVNGVTYFATVINDTFPVAANAQEFSGFITFVGSTQQDGSYYVSISGNAYLITPETAINKALQVGDYVIGLHLDNTVVVIDKENVSYDRSRYRILYQPIDEVITIKDENAPSGETIVAISLGETTVDINSYTPVMGSIEQGKTAIVVLDRDEAKSVYVTDEEKQYGKSVIYGMVTQIERTSFGYTLQIDQNEYRTNHFTRMENQSKLELGAAVAAITDANGNLDLLYCFDNVVSSFSNLLHLGRIERVGSDGIDIEGKIFGIDWAFTNVKGNVAEGKYAALIGKEGDNVDLVYIFPSTYADYDYKVDSGVLHGLHSSNGEGKRSILLDDKMYLLNSNSRVNNVLKYDEIGVALYRGTNTISVIDVISKPNDKMRHFEGKISNAVSSKALQQAAFIIDDFTYNVYPVSSLVDFNDITRIYKGAKVEGYAFGDEVLAIRLVRGAGLLGILNPPWLEYAILGLLIALLLFLLLWQSRKNRTYWVTGFIDVGSNDSIIFHEDNGEINNYQVEPELFEFLMNFKEQEITVRIKNGEIVEIR